MWHSCALSPDPGPESCGYSWLCSPAGNKELTIPSPLTPLLTALPRVSILDFRGVHKEKGAYWSDAKCLTMKHVAAMAKLLKRRKYAHRVLMDTQ